MRQFTCLMFLILPFLFLAQHRVIAVTGTKQEWAGGIAGNAGTNYTLLLQSNEIDLQSLVIERIAIDGNCLSSGWQINHSPNGMTISFGTYYNPYREPYKDRKEITHKDHLCPSNSVRLLIKGKTQDIPVSELKELPHLAYP